MQVLLHLDGSPLSCTGEITMVDVTAGEAVLAFRDVSPEDLARVERYVMSRLFTAR